MIDLSKVTRVETIDHKQCTHCHGSGVIHIEGQPGNLDCPGCGGSGMLGRTVILNDPSKSIEAELQDDGRTLKIYIKERV